MPVLAAASAAVWLAWNTFLVTPLKILTVFFHEISHGLAAYATGGSVDSLIVRMNQGGLAKVQGGWLFLVYNAGYLGSLLFGCGLILLSAYSRRDRTISLVLGAALGVISVVFVRNVTGVAFGLAAAAALVWAAVKLSEGTNDFLIKVVGVTSAMYVIPDVWSDVFARSCPSDASFLAQLTGVPKYFWGAAWMALGAAALWGTLRLAARAGQKRLL